MKCCLGTCTVLNPLSCNKGSSPGFFFSKINFKLLKNKNKLGTGKIFTITLLNMYNGACKKMSLVRIHGCFLSTIHAVSGSHTWHQINVVGFGCTERH